MTGGACVWERGRHEKIREYTTEGEIEKIQSKQKRVLKWRVFFLSFFFFFLFAFGVLLQSEITEDFQL